MTAPLTPENLRRLATVCGLQYEPCNSGLNVRRGDSPWFNWNPFTSIADNDGLFVLRPGSADFEANCKRKGTAMNRVGKKAAGRLLDGREWNQIPERTPNAR